MELFPFCSQVHHFKGKIVAQTDEKSYEKTKSREEIKQLGGIWAVAATTGHRGHQGQAVVASSRHGLDFPLRLHFGASSLLMVLVMVHPCWVIFGPSCKLLGFICLQYSIYSPNSWPI